jgi:hypothetical protein
LHAHELSSYRGIMLGNIARSSSKIGRTKLK